MIIPAKFILVKSTGLRYKKAKCRVRLEILLMRQNELDAQFICEAAGSTNFPDEKKLYH